jgi:hypothetical protein
MSQLDFATYDVDDQLSRAHLFQSHQTLNHALLHHVGIRTAERTLGQVKEVEATDILDGAPMRKYPFYRPSAYKIRRQRSFR